MGLFDNPFRSAIKLGACSCGRHGSQTEHEAATARDIMAVAQSGDGRVNRVLESAVMRERARRRDRQEHAAAPPRPQ